MNRNKITAGSVLIVPAPPEKHTFVGWLMIFNNSMRVGHVWSAWETTIMIAMNKFGVEPE